MSKLLLTTVAAFVCFTASVIGAVVVLNHQPQQAPSFGGSEPNITNVQNKSVVSVGTATTQVVATTTGRRSLMLQNIGSTVAYCMFSNTAVDQMGFVMLASSTRSFPEGNQPTIQTAINCIASSTVKVLVNEAY